MSRSFNTMPTWSDGIDVPPTQWANIPDREREARIIGNALVDWQNRPRLPLECFEDGKHRAAWRLIQKASTPDEVPRHVFDDFEHRADPTAEKQDLDCLVARYGARNGLEPLRALLDYIGPGANKERYESELRKRAWAAEVDPASPPEPDAPVFKVAGKLSSTSGNLTAIVAPAKSGKTAVVGSMASACMVADGLGNSEADTLGITSEPPGGKAVVIVDTEQSPSYACKLIGKALARIGLAPECKPPWLHLFANAGWSPLELSNALPLILSDAAERHGGIHAVLIDGGADFAANVNDPEEAANLVGAWHALAIQHRCAIVVVIHSNEGAAADETARGWLGKQLRRKAESNLQLKRLGEFTVLFGEKGQRHAPIFEKDGPTFAWSDEAGMHVRVQSAGDMAIDKKRVEMLELARDVFGEKRLMKWAEIHPQIMVERGCSRNTAERHIKKMRELGVIRNAGFGQYEVCE